MSWRTSTIGPGPASRGAAGRCRSTPRGVPTSCSTGPASTCPTSDDWDTVAGFVVDALGRLPELGDEIEIDSGSLRVERVDGTRIVRLAYLPHALLTDETGKESSRG